MKKTIILIFTVLLLISHAGATIPGRQGIEVTKVAWGDLSNPVIVYPGDKNTPLLIEIKNVDRELGAIRATLDIEDPFFFSYITNMTTELISKEPLKFVVGEVKDNQSVVLKYNLDINRMAQPGTYKLNLDVVYLEDLIRSERFQIYVSVGEKSEITLEKITFDPPIVTAGEDMAVQFLLSNSGTTDIKDIKISLNFSNSEQFPFVQIDTDASQFTSNLPKGVTKLVQFKFNVLQDARPQTYSALLNLEYRDSNGERRFERKAIGMYVHEPKQNAVLELKEIELEPNAPISGDKITLSTLVFNPGLEKLRDIQLALDLNKVHSYEKETNSPFALYDPQPIKYLRELPPNSGAAITFKIIIDGSAKPRPYSLNLLADYRDEQGNRKNTSVMIGIPIHGVVDFEIQDLKFTPESGSIEKNTDPVKGDLSTLEFDLINTGTETAGFVTVSIPENPVLDIKIPLEKFYIGPLDPDDFGTVKIGIKIRDESGELKFPINISYLDSYNQKRSETKYIPIKILEAPKQKAINNVKNENVLLRFLKWLFGV